MSKVILKNKTYICLTAIIIAGFIIQLYLYAQTPYIQGQDGGYYAYNVNDLLEKGRMDGTLLDPPPLFFYLSALFAQVAGISLGVKMATVLFSVLTGFAIFILTKYLTGKNLSALTAAFLTIFNPSVLRLGADIRKNAAVLFFIPLIFYFLLKINESLGKKELDLKKIIYQLISLTLLSVLAVLTHKSIIIVWIIMLGYFGFKIGAGKIVNKKVFLPFYLINVIFVIIFIVKYGLVSGELTAISASVGFIGKELYEEHIILLTSFLLPLWVIAIPGLAVIFKGINEKRNRSIFIGSWLLISFLFTLPQVNTGQNWRFVLIALLPLTVTAGYSAVWLKEKFGYFGYSLVMLPISLIMLFQMFNYGLNDGMMKAMIPERIMASIEKSSQTLSPDPVLYSSISRGNGQYWMRFFFGPNTRNFYGPKSLSEMADSIYDGKIVYYLTVNQKNDLNQTRANSPGQALPSDIKSELREKMGNPLPPPNMGNLAPAQNNPDEIPLALLQNLFEIKEAYIDNEIIVFQLASVKQEMPPEPINPGSNDNHDNRTNSPNNTELYGQSRLKYISSYFILPYEIINMINPDYRALWQIQFGLPLSMIILGFIISYSAKKYYRYFKTDYPMIIFLALLIGLIFFIRPGFIWGLDAKTPFNTEQQQFPPQFR